MFKLKRELLKFHFAHVLLKIINLKTHPIFINKPNILFYYYFTAAW